MLNTFESIIQDKMVYFCGRGRHEKIAFLGKYWN